MCNTVQYSAIQCTTVQYGAVQCSTVLYRAVQFSTLQYISVLCTIVQYCSLQCSNVHYNAVLCTTMQCCALQCSTLHYNVVLCTTMQHCAGQKGGNGHGYWLPMNNANLTILSVLMLLSVKEYWIMGSRQKTNYHTSLTHWLTALRKVIIFHPHWNNISFH